MSFTLTTNIQPSNQITASSHSLSDSDVANVQANNSSFALPTAALTPFVASHSATSYVDPSDGQLYAAGYNSTGMLGLGNTTDQQSFTPIYKNGDPLQPFLNPIDWQFSNSTGAVIDADGKLWTTGRQYYGILGNGVVSTTNQNKFMMVEINGSTNYNAIAVRIGSQSTIVVLDNGDIYGAGNYSGLGLSSGSYSTFTKLSLGIPTGRTVVDFQVNGNNDSGYGCSLWLLDDGSLWRCNSNGWAEVGTNVTSFDSLWTNSYYVNTAGDVYYSSSNTATFTKIVDSSNYEGTIDSVYTSTNVGWAYLTTNGDAYYASTNGGKVFTQVASDVAYFDIGGNVTTTVLGAVTNTDTFKLWGSDLYGMLANGTAQGSTDITLEVFLSETATVSTPTTNGKDVTIQTVILPALAPALPIGKEEVNINNIYIYFNGYWVYVFHSYNKHPTF